jgi:hypothetical protein
MKSAMNKPLILQHTSKSSNGRSARSIVLYGRCAVCFGLRWKPTEGWVWPANTRSKHMEHDTLRVQHKNALKESKVPPFVIYSFRHTFLTRLGESGCDAWTLARIAGHSNIAISQRYVSPSGDAVLSAMSRLDGHNFGHNEKMVLSERTESETVTDSQ